MQLRLFARKLKPESDEVTGDKNLALTVTYCPLSRFSNPRSGMSGARRSQLVGVMGSAFDDFAACRRGAISQTDCETHVRPQAVRMMSVPFVTSSGMSWSSPGRSSKFERGCVIPRPHEVRFESTLVAAGKRPQAAVLAGRIFEREPDR